MNPLELAVWAAFGVAAAACLLLLIEQAAGRVRRRLEVSPRHCARLIARRARRSSRAEVHPDILGPALSPVDADVRPQPSASTGLHRISHG